MIAVESKLTALENILSVYRTHTADLQIACSKSCAHCCTTDVTMSTLEGYQFWRGLDSDERSGLAAQLEGSKNTARFRPVITINQLADICAAGEDPPEEEKAGQTTPCPLLDDDLCTVYRLRPFHCRCMVSRQVCQPSGYAEMDDFTMTLNSVFLQVIEHLDTPGCTGNLLDVMSLMFSSAGRKDYESSRCDCRATGLIPNRSLTKLMVPPEYQNRIAPVLSELQAIQI